MCLCKYLGILYVHSTYISIYKLEQGYTLIILDIAYVPRYLIALKPARMTLWPLPKLTPLNPTFQRARAAVGTVAVY